jgi:hypothetical protein
MTTNEFVREHPETAAKVEAVAKVARRSNWPSTKAIRVLADWVAVRGGLDYDNAVDIALDLILGPGKPPATREEK